MVGLDVPRNAYYEKELQLRVSRSYGPGRYDRRYEEEGVDYPIGYVRWTEQRNMEAFLNLVADREGKVQPGRLVTHRFPIEDAARAYQVVTGETAEPSLGILLSYRRLATSGSCPAIASPARPPSARRSPVGGCAWAWSAQAASPASVLLPELRRMGERVELRGVATASGPSAQQTMSRFGFGYASVDWRELVHDPDLDAVLVATRHDLHAEIAGEALRAGKSVLLEKPMALDDEQLSHLLAAWEANPRVLQVGFNRRFSPTIPAALEQPTPLDASHSCCSTGSTPARCAPGSWVVDADQGGGRLIGEVCHMVDTLFFLTGARWSSGSGHSRSRGRLGPLPTTSRSRSALRTARSARSSTPRAAIAACRRSGWRCSAVASRRCWTTLSA